MSIPSEPVVVKNDASYFPLIVMTIFALLAIFWVGTLIFENNSPNPSDFTGCFEMANNPGTDFAHAQCVDDNGKVIDFKDSRYNLYVK